MDQKAAKSKKVLLVEDDYFISDLYTRSLEKAGFVVDYAKDGQEGLEKSVNLPDIILLDIMMPKMNGLQVLEHLKKNPQTCNIPVLLLTNLGQSDVIKKAYNLGAQGYLMKVKLDIKNLINYVNEFIYNPKKIIPIGSLDLDPD